MTTTFFNCSIKVDGGNNYKLLQTKYKHSKPASASLKSLECGTVILNLNSWLETSYMNLTRNGVFWRYHGQMDADRESFAICMLFAMLCIIHEQSWSENCTPGGGKNFDSQAEKKVPCSIECRLTIA